MDAFEKVRAIGRAVLDFPDRIKETHPACVEGEKHFDAGNHAEAEACFQKAVTELKANAAPRARQARVLLRLAHSQWTLKKVPDAKATAESAHEHLTAKRKPSPDLSACLDLLGSLLEAENDLEGARARFREALEVQKKLHPVQPAMLTERHRRLALSLATVDATEARTHYKRAIEIAEKRLGTRSSTTAECLLDLGRFELLHGDKDAGVAAIERAIDIHKETNGEVSDELARAFQFAAQACQEGGDLERSVSYYEHALKVRERQLGGSAADFATLLMGLAESHTMLGNDAPAMELLQEAVGKLASSGGERYAVALESLGEVYAGVNRFPDAISCFKKARVVWEKQPQVYQGALTANAQLLDHAMHYVPVEPGAGMPLFKFGSRSRGGDPAMRQRMVVDTAPTAPDPVPAPERMRNTPAAPDTGFLFGFGQPTSPTPAPVAWVPVDFAHDAVPGAPAPAARAAETTPYQAPVPEQMAMPVSLARLVPAAVAPPVVPPAVSSVIASPIAAPVPATVAVPTVPAAPPPISSPIPENVAGSNLLVSFVNADGSPIAVAQPASPQEPVQMTIIVPEEGMPKHVVLAPADPPGPAPAAPNLTGWDELSFEFLSLS